VRPLDRFQSIKMKLGVLVVASASGAGFLVAIGVSAGIHARYVVSAAVIASLAVTQVLAHGMTSPLRFMADAATAMAQGDYSRRVQATSRDEVGRLAVAFNQMAADLQAVDLQRRELIANVSHELRTPVAALRAVLDNIVDGVTEPDTATMKQALEQTERLGRLVETFLDLSRLDAGVTPLERDFFPMEPFLSAVAREVDAAAGRPVRYDVDVAPAGLTGYADRERLHQVVVNLLVNAAKHSPVDGLVLVRARPTLPGDSGAVRLEVADEGPGISLEERSHVFERFNRGGHTTIDGGTGLGLAIARWAVDLHGGTIAVAESERGCLIRVDLPGSS
jgi:signal transduction histidine kinase